MTTLEISLREPRVGRDVLAALVRAGDVGLGSADEVSGSVVARVGDDGERDEVTIGGSDGTETGCVRKELGRSCAGVVSTRGG